MNKRKSLKIAVLILFIFFISILSVYRWFEGGTILYYWDAFIPFDIKYYFTFLQSWQSRVFPGNTNAAFNWVLYIFPISLLENIFDSLSMAQAFIYIGLIFSSIINFYLLLRYLFNLILMDKIKENIAVLTSIIFSILYALNLYTFYSAYFMFNPEAYILAFLPLNILALLHFFPLDESEKLKNQKFWIFVFFLSLFLMSPGFVTYVFFAQYIVWVFIFLVFYFLFSKEKYKKKFLNILLFFLLIILANWWWFFPFLLNIQSSYAVQRFTTDTTSYIESSSKNGYLFNAVRLIGSSLMNSNQFSWTSLYYDKNPFNFVLFFFPFLIIFLLLRIKLLVKKKILLFIFTIFLVSLFLVKLGNPPFAGLTVWAFKHIPFFDAFRDAYQKAGLYYIFSYFILSFIGFNLLTSFLMEKNNKVLIYITYSLLFLGAIVMTGPFFLFRTDNIIKLDHIYNGKKITFSAKTKIPKEYYDLKNILEKNCTGKTTIVIPRGSAITNAFWLKYGTSYIGQDILSHLVNCNFISKKIAENDPDAFTSAPYVFLQNNDFSSFKNYLLQNDISLVLVKKDSIPFTYTSWFQVDPQKTIVEIETDKDIEKIYENDFFNLYKLKTESLNTFGFNLSQNIIYTNSPLSTTVDYAILSKAIGSESGNLIINKSNNFKKYSGSINQYVSVGNCVGCVQISSKDLLKVNSQNDLFQNVKAFLKKYFKFLNKNESVDTKISKNLINSTYEFNKLLQFIKDKKTDEVKKSVYIYTNYITQVLNYLKQYNQSFFDRNQKFLETQNYLTAQNNSLFNILSQDGEQIKNSSIEVLLNFMLLYQNKSLDYVNKNAWQTDKENKIYRVRLDIAKEGDYECKSNTFTQGIYPTKIALDGENPSTIDGSYHFKRGSYPISINYEVLSAVNLPEIGIGPIKEIALGKLPNGSYELSFNTDKVNKILFVLITNKKIDLNNFVKGSFDPLSQSLKYEYFIPGPTTENVYKKDFHIDSLSSDNYYLYLVVPSAYRKIIEEEKITNLVVEKTLEENEIVFYCSSFYINRESEEKIDVAKVSNVEYDIKLPKKIDSKFLLFNQSFNNDWTAFSDKQALHHFSNGYANAWNITNANNNKIKVIFSRQNTVVNNIILSVILFAILLVIFLKIYKKNDR
ncbi:MAG: hypothetical protein ABH812_04200 [bacterium]